MTDGSTNVVLNANDQLAIGLMQFRGAAQTIIGAPSASWITIRFVRPLP